MQCIAISPDDYYIAYGGSMPEIVIMKTSNYRIVKISKMHKNWIRALDFSPDN